MAHSVEQMRACIAREIRMREKSYPRWVAQGKLTQATADHELSCMYSVLATIGDSVVPEIEPVPGTRKALESLFNHQKS